ncbi:Peptide transporter family 1 [Aphelenchoides fujianensis]|nr:Peptide transporter family 1 [Aphelenchoides fujianensis]
MPDAEFERAVADGLLTEHEIRVYSIAQQVMLASSILTAGALVFVILKASPKTMLTYKWLLLNQMASLGESSTIAKLYHQTSPYLQIVLFFIAEAACLVFVLVYSALVLQSRKNAFHAKTYRLQAMLLKSCAAQVAGTWLTMAVPFMTCLALVFFAIPGSNYSRLSGVPLRSPKSSQSGEKIHGEVQTTHAAHPEPTTSWSGMIRKWPMTTFCILVNEFCERFSFYGMRTVLTLYLVNVLRFGDAYSTTFFHAFSALCFFSPIFGSILADGYVGKFNTIFYVSFLHAAGQLVLAFATAEHSGSRFHPWIDLAAFDAWETKMITVWFSVFYFCINIGGMVSIFVSPIFRSMSCLGQDSCYPLAFGVSAALMLIATVVFMLGSPWYKKKPTTSNVFADVWRLCTRALGQKFRSSEPKAHWLDHALTTHDCEQSTACQSLKRRRHDQSACAEARFVEDVKSLFRVLIMYLPLPMFWALYDQQGSVWNLQAIRMNSRLWGTTLLLPDQMGTLNAFLILAFIPFFEGVVYPIARKVVTLTPLRKMVVGGLLASVAFVICGLTQTEVNKTLAIIPPAGRAYVSLMNTLPDCSINATVGDRTAFIPAGTSLENTHDNRQLFDVPKGNVEFSFAFSGADCFPDVLPTSATFNVTHGQIFFVHVSQHGIFLSPSFKTVETTHSNFFHPLLTSAFSVTIATDKNYDGNFAFCREKKATDQQPCNPKEPSDFYLFAQNYTDGGRRASDLIGDFPYVTKSNGSTHVAAVFDAKPIRPGSWRLFYVQGTPSTADETNATYTGIRFERLEQGGVYMLSLTGSFAAYTQAAPPMKSIVGGFYLVTMGVGDTCIVIFTLLFRNMNPATVCFIYAALMLAVIVIFGFMAVFYYQYANIDEEEDNLVDCSSSEGEETSVDLKRLSLLNGDLLAATKDETWDSKL